MALEFPNIDPVALEIGPLVIRWYALAYLAGFVLGWWYCLRLAAAKAQRLPEARPTADDLGDFLTWAIIAVILGGRIGFILFYNLDQYLRNPLEMLVIWRGGMSFHGGMMGVVVAILLFSHRRGFSPFALGDLVAACAPIGLFLGRIANFINGELYGRPAPPDLPWAMVFPGDPEGLARHPSQLYQAGLEGLLLFIVLAWIARRPGVLERTGTLSGAFLIGYGLCRIAAEFFRQPDVQVGYLAFGITMGQILSIPMILAGIWLIQRAPFGGKAHR
ncbi:MAG: putative prolipoprotein diacylglyceryl transferase, Lgt family [Pseudomonadota bacterium]|jgi:phosphatidylglycerol:prolipoprotein diacylglycerol transferase